MITVEHSSTLQINHIQIDVGANDVRLCALNHTHFIRISLDLLQKSKNDQFRDCFFTKISHFRVSLLHEILKSKNPV